MATITSPSRRPKRRNKGLTLTLPRIVIGNKKAKTVRRRVAPRPGQAVPRRPDAVSAVSRAAPQGSQGLRRPVSRPVAPRPARPSAKRPARPVGPPPPPKPIIGRDGREILPPPKWSLLPFQKHAELEPLHSAGEYADEARMEKPIIRLGGRRYSAFRSPGTISRRYQRHNQFFGGLGAAKVKTLLTIATLVLTAAAFATVFISSANETGRTIESNPIFEAFLASGVAVVVSAGGSFAFWIKHQFKRSYLRVSVFERSEETEEWNTTGELRLYVPRLAFIDSAQKGDYFSGPTRQSGAEHGSVHVDLPLGYRIVDMKSYADVYDLEPSVSTFTEVPQRQTYQFLQECVDAGTLARFAGKSKLGKLLSENAAWIVTAVFGILTFFMVMGGAQPQ